MKSLRLILIDIEIDIYAQHIKSAKSYNFAPRCQSIAHQYPTRFSKPNRKIEFLKCGILLGAPFLWNKILPVLKLFP